MKSIYLLPIALFVFSFNCHAHIKPTGFTVSVTNSSIANQIIAYGQKGAFDFGYTLNGNTIKQKWRWVYDNANAKESLNSCA